MADTTTTNLGLTKPEVGASADTWGTKLNTDLDTIDAVFAAAGGGTSVGLNVGSGKVLNIAGNVSVNGATLSPTELGYLDGVTSAIQTQLNAKEPTITTLGVARGGTGATSLTSGYLVKGNGTAAASASVVYDDGTNVGIGTSSPGAKLEVAGGYIYNSASTTSGTVGLIGKAAGSNTFIVGSDNAINGGTDQGLSLYSYGATNLRLYTNGAERARIDASGNLGIGTSSPSSFSGYTSLTVSNPTNGGLVEATNGTRTIRMQSQASGSALMGTTTSHTLGLMTAGVERVTLDTSGNLGIGTSSVTPYFGTTIKAYSASGATYQAYGPTVQSAFWSSEGLGIAALETISNHPLVFGTNSAERARIDASGNLGIGTSSPGSKLHVSGSEVRLQGTGSFYSFYDTAGTTRVGYIQNATGNIAIVNEQAGYVNFYTSNTERARIDSSGNLLVGTTTAPLSGVAGVQIGTSFIRTGVASTTATGHIAFNNPNGEVGLIVTSGTSTSYNTSSDARLKHDIIDAPEASTLIDQIKVRSFKWNADDSTQRYGFIAQELVEVAPEAVNVPADEEAMMGVDYSKLVPMLVKEIQSLRARVAQLEGN